MARKPTIILSPKYFHRFKEVVMWFSEQSRYFKYRCPDGTVLKNDEAFGAWWADLREYEAKNGPPKTTPPQG